MKVVARNSVRLELIYQNPAGYVLPRDLNYLFTKFYSNQSRSYGACSMRTEK